MPLMFTPLAAGAIDQEWGILLQIILLLATALILGTIAEQLRQSAIVGYLLAGTLVGPGFLRIVYDAPSIEFMAELGAGLLLFTIGLEFSFQRLRRMGPVVLLGGVLQIVVTIAVVATVVGMLGGGVKTGIVLGTMVALSSTACVLRLLVDRASLESTYGRTSMGILLLQDVAVLPLTLVVSALAHGGTVSETFWAMGRTIFFGVLMIATFVVLFHFVVPRLLNIRRWASNREFPILLAIVLAAGSAAAAHAIDISPAIGAFVAGVLLAESPFATQIRADVASLKTLFVTLFFASIGLLTDPAWVFEHIGMVTSVAALVILGKIVIVWGVLRLLGQTNGVPLATGFCLAQIGEFSFVLAQIALQSNGDTPPLIDSEMMRLIVSATVVSLLVTPYLVRIAPSVAARVEHILHRRRAKGDPTLEPSPTIIKPPGGSIVIVGFGPAGQKIVETLDPQHREGVLVIDQNPRSALATSHYGVSLYTGNAGQPEVLEHAHVGHADVVVITIPDPAAALQIIHLCRDLNPNIHIIARSRHHLFWKELQQAGAQTVVDEEEQVGLSLATEVRNAVQAVVK